MMMASENPHCSCSTSRDPVEDLQAPANTTTDWGKLGVLRPRKVSRSGLRYPELLPEVSDSPVRLFWVSFFNELIYPNS